MSDTLQYYVLKKGATGAVLTATLKDEDDAAVDLSGYGGVTVSLRKQNTSDDPVVDGAVCTVVTAASGIISYSFDGSAIHDADAGRYDIEFKATDGNGDIHIFPTNKRYPYGELILQDSL